MQPLLRCPKKSFGRYSHFSSVFSTATPTPTRFIAFSALVGVAHAGPGAQVQIPFPPQKTKSSRPTGRLLFSWRRRRDLNPRAGYPTYSLSRGAPSPLGYFCMVKLNLTIYNQVVKPVINVWRREWDSNPRCLATRRFSRPFRYDHFGISP